MASIRDRLLHCCKCGIEIPVGAGLQVGADLYCSEECAEEDGAGTSPDEEALFAGDMDWDAVDEDDEAALEDLP